MLGGCPTAYKPENAEIVRHARVLGATNQTLSSFPPPAPRTPGPRPPPACWRRAAPRCPTFRYNGRPPLRWKVKPALIGVTLAETAETPAA